MSTTDPMSARPGPPDLPGGPVGDSGVAPVALSEEPDSTPLPGGEVRNTSQAPVKLAASEWRLFVQELVRAGLALSFVVLLALAMILGYHKIGTSSWADAKEYLDILVPALSALLGSATGFYFASRR